MGIDLVARAKNYSASSLQKDRRIVYKSALRDVETWLREYQESWCNASDRLNNDPTFTEGGADGIEDAADELKRILEEIDG